MAKEEKPPKFDPNSEAYQMREQLKKVETCKQLWQENWSWLLEERKLALDEANAIRQEAAGSVLAGPTKTLSTKSLQPVPRTSTGFIGWLASKPECQLEIYKSSTPKIPVRLPDAWDRKDYVGPPK